MLRRYGGKAVTFRVTTYRRTAASPAAATALARPMRVVFRAVDRFPKAGAAPPLSPVMPLLVTWVVRRQPGAYLGRFAPSPWSFIGVRHHTGVSSTVCNGPAVARADEECISRDENGYVPRVSLRILAHALLPGLRRGSQIMGMAAVPPSVTTLDEFFALPEDNARRHELLDGVYVVSPPPSFRHQRAVMMLYHRLAPAIQDLPDLLLFPVPGDIVLGARTVVEPDLFLIPRPPRVDIHWRDVARPLLVIEILSPSTATRDRLVKRRLYQQTGIPEYWIVDLDARLVERWWPGDDRPEILSETLTWQPPDSTVPFELDLAAFFAEVLEGQ